MSIELVRDRCIFNKMIGRFASLFTLSMINYALTRISLIAVDVYREYFKALTLIPTMDAEVSDVIKPE